jgi:hypothetical protein
LTACRDDEVITEFIHPPDVADLRHIARWWRTRTLSNPHSRIAGGVLLEVIEPQPDDILVPRQRAPVPPTPDGVLRLTYTVEDGEPVPPGRFLRLRNTTNIPLHCVLLNLTERFRIHADLFRSGRIEPGGIAEAHAGQIVDFYLPGDLENRPGSTYRDWLMLIVSTDLIDAAPYELPEVDTCRDVGPNRSRGGKLTADWWTSVLKVVTTVPHDSPGLDRSASPSVDAHRER